MNPISETAHELVVPMKKPIAVLNQKKLETEKSARNLYREMVWICLMKNDLNESRQLKKITRTNVRKLKLKNQSLENQNTIREVERIRIK